MDKDQLLRLTADLAAAHVSSNDVPIGDLPGLVQVLHKALSDLTRPVAPTVARVPCVSVKASVRSDYLICLECGTKQKLLKRHLRTAHGMTPAQYRRDYGLPGTYPMVSASYSKRRSEMAKAFGLGKQARKRRDGADGGATSDRPPKSHGS